MSLIRSKPQFYSFFFPCKCAEVLGWLCPVRSELSQGCSPCAPVPGKAPAAMPELFLTVLSQLCLSHLAGQGQECSMWDQVLVSPSGSHWHLSNRRYPEAALQVSSKPRLVSFLFPAAAVAAFILLNSLTSQQGCLPDSVYFYIPFASHILPHGCLTAF